MKFDHKVAISRIVVAIVFVIIIVVAAAAIVLSTSKPQTTSSSSSTSPPSSSSTATSTSQASTNSSSLRNLLRIDEMNWPSNDMNELWAFSYIPWPNWNMYDVYQPLVFANETLEYNYVAGQPSQGTQNKIQFMPGLAQNWTVSSDASTYTFNLRPHINFSNGDPFNAYQVWMEMYGFYYLSGNSSGFLGSYNVFDMSPVVFGPATITLINSSGGVTAPSGKALSTMTNSSWPIYVVSPTQIVFHLKAPFVWFPGILVGAPGLLFDTQYVLNHGGFGAPASINTYFNQHSIPGTGPYVVTSFAENNYIEYGQDPNYWGRNLSPADIATQPLLDPGHVKNVLVYFKQDDLTRYTDISTGAVDISTVSNANWQRVVSDPQFNYFVNPPWSGQTFEVGLNTHLYPTNITDVRLAIVHAINYSQIRQQAFLGLVFPFVGPEYPGWKDFYDLGGYQPYSYNITLAKQYLQQANVTNMPTFTLRGVAAASCSACATADTIIQSDLAQIGIQVNVVPVASIGAWWSIMGGYSYLTNATVASEIGQLVFQAYGWAPGTLTPADLWVSFVYNQSVFGNWPVYSNPIVNNAVNAMLTSSNVTYIQSLLTAAQKQIYDDAPWAWIGNGMWQPGGGSLVWKPSVISHFYVDPVWSGANDAPIFNTVLFT